MITKPQSRGTTVNEGVTPEHFQAPTGNNALTHHPLLVPYEDLPECKKEKERDAVRNIPNLLTKAKCLIRAV